MSVEDDVRRALQPLTEKGLVHSVGLGNISLTEGRVLGDQIFAIDLNIAAEEDPETYRPMIDEHLQSAGIRDVMYGLRRWAPSA
jgi:hypothetical protein